MPSDGCKQTLEGHGDAVNDLVRHPVDPNLLLSASKDESMRLWNVESGVCIVLFVGHAGHRSDVLSCVRYMLAPSSPDARTKLQWQLTPLSACAAVQQSIHMLGNVVASGGMDNEIKLWSLDKQPVQDAIAASYKHAGKPVSTFKSATEQFPAWSTNKVGSSCCSCGAWCSPAHARLCGGSQVHKNYVDYVEWAGDLLITKSTHNVVR